MGGGNCWYKCRSISSSLDRAEEDKDPECDIGWDDESLTKHELDVDKKTRDGKEISKFNVFIGRLERCIYAIWQLIRLVCSVYFFIVAYALL